LVLAWCGHCKKLAPIWDQLGEKLKDVKNVVIAKIDASNNDAQGVEIQGFPTIILFKANDNERVNFEGDRTVGGFVDFLVKNAVYGSEIGNAGDADASDDAASEEDASDEL
jgi:protein disulfide-isomerase A1